MFPAHNLNTLVNVITHLEMFTLHNSKNPVKISAQIDIQTHQSFYTKHIIKVFGLGLTALHDCADSRHLGVISALAVLHAHHRMALTLKLQAAYTTCVKR